MAWRTLSRIVLRSAGIAALSLVLAVVLFHFVFQPFQVAGLSMSPSLEDRDFLLVDRVFFRIADLRRGDIVVFQSPADGRFLVKRVAALSGDTVAALPDGSLTVNGAERLPAGSASGVAGTARVAPETVFLLGDNAGHSQDSRTFGAVPFSRVYGRVLLRYFPPAPIPASAPGGGAP